MVNRWFINTKKLKSTNNNYRNITDYFDGKDFYELKNIVNDNQKNNLLKSCEVWIKNCKSRNLFSILYLSISLFIFIFGIILFCLHFEYHIKKHELLISGLVFIIFPIICSCVLYLADNWYNPFMYDWSLILEKMKPYIINNMQNLPLSIYYFYFGNDINNKEKYKFFYDVKTNNVPKSLKKYVKSQLEASVARFYNNDPTSEEVDKKTLYEYWGEISVIFEWAYFLKKFCLYINAKEGK